MGAPNLSPVSQHPLARWAIPPAPTDPILHINTQFKSDKHPHALNLGVGAYRDASGHPHQFRAVAKARARLVASNAHANHQYLPIEGNARLAQLSSKIIFGHHFTHPIATVQTISGSGALRVALEFCTRVLACQSVFVPDPTWSNHYQMVPDAGLSLRTYRYYNSDRNTLDIEALLADLKEANENTVVILHPCAHNPTGADPSQADWVRIRDVIQARRCVPLFDMAYQGLASGDVHNDAYAVRLMAASVPTLVAQSYSKNMGLYNSRVGTLSVSIPGLPAMVNNALSQLKWIIRTMYSSPPAFGARIVEEVLGDDALRDEWLLELREMVERLDDMRGRLLFELKERAVGGKWAHLVKTRGMFVLLGLTAHQVESLRDTHHIYMTKDSRVNVAGLTEDNIEQLADGIAEVFTGEMLQR